MQPFHLRVALILVSTGLPWGQSQIGSYRYLEFPDVRQGKVLKATKVLDPGTGRIQVRLFEDGTELAIPITQLEQQEAAFRLSQNGPLEDGLAALLPNLGPNDKVKVAIHLKQPPILYPDKTRVSPEEARSASIAAMGLAPVVSLDAFRARHGFLGLAARGNDIVEGELTRGQLESLKSDADVGQVALLREDAPMAPELTTLTVSAYNPGPVPSSSGSGVNAATFETGLLSDFLSCIGVTPIAWDANHSADPWEIRHAEATFRLLASTAPSARLYHYGAATYNGTNDQNYLVNNGIQSVSLSYTRGGTTPYHSTYPEFLVMDDFAYRYPYPVFVDGAANAGYTYETNWQCYNALSVGNVRHTNNSTYELADCTQTKNPPPVYGNCISGTGANCAGDREMPYVVVPGLAYTGTTFASTCLGGSGNLGCGTSWSAPIGNGLAADVISADSRMVSWPEKVRAALMLTAQNVDGGYWSPTTDGRDGNGVVSGSDAVAFAQSHTSVSIGNSPAVNGMGAGSLYPIDFGTGNKRFYFMVSNPKPAGKHFRVVLTWDSNPIVGGTTNALSDLDLVVQTNWGTRTSSSWDGNVEVVDVPAEELSVGGPYYIDLAPAINRIPASGARATFIYYAIAWTWVKDHAD